MLIVKTSISDHEFFYTTLLILIKLLFSPTLEFSYRLSFIISRKQVTEMSNVTINTSVAGESLKPEEIIRIIESLRLEKASKIIGSHC